MNTQTEYIQQWNIKRSHEYTEKVALSRDVKVRKKLTKSQTVVRTRFVGDSGKMSKGKRKTFQHQQ